tara:strand:+ start:510 stop:1028 length:519 start_codon:yes stop_codon:yes gene_type:complete
MGQSKTFPSTSAFPLEVSDLEREELENHYCNLRDNYKRLKISRGLLLNHAGTKALLIEKNQILANAKRDLENQIEEIKRSKAGTIQSNLQILENVVSVFDQMEDLGNELVIGYNDYEKGRRAFAGGPSIRTLIRSVINFFNSWSLIKEQIESIKDQIKSLASGDKSETKKLK